MGMVAEGTERRIHAVDLFCGVGGLTHGLVRSGISVRVGFDNDESCQYAYEANNPDARFVAADICQIGREDLEPYFEDADVSVLVGCAPCQPFSAHNRKLRKEADCSLVDEFARLVEETRPDFVSMENVPGLARHDVFTSFCELWNDSDTTTMRLSYGAATTASLSRVAG